MFYRIKGKKFSFTHVLAKTYEEYVSAGWPELRDLRLMTGALMDWEAGARYKDSFAATVSQLKDAMEILKELEKRLMDYLKSEDDENSQSVT